MNKAIHLLLPLTLSLAGSAQAAAPSYPPVSAYMMPRDAEIALARTAAPDSISGPAAIRILTPAGYTDAVTGTNGFVCMVMRGFTAPSYTPAMILDLVYDPSVRAPICFNAQAAQQVMPYYELRTRLGLQGKTPAQITAGVEVANKDGTLPQRTGVSFAYMWSAEQNLGPAIGHWHPHLMIFAPYLTNDMLGNNPFGTPLPQLTDDAGTPFAVAVVPVDMHLAVGHASPDMTMPGH